MISTTVTVSKIVINSNGNIIPRLSQDENAAQVHSEALQVAISTKLKVRDRTMTIVLYQHNDKFYVILKVRLTPRLRKIEKLYLYAFVGGMVTVMNAAGQPIQLPAATLQAAKAQNGIGIILLCPI